MHHLAERVTHECEEARTGFAKFLNASRKEEIIFTRNTTEGINLVANSLGLKKGDVVLISDKEHNSNLIPWQMLAKRSTWWSASPALVAIWLSSTRPFQR
jgi:cysteine desulfurase/selenocysteine lyase